MRKESIRLKQKNRTFSDMISKARPRTALSVHEKRPEYYAKKMHKTSGHISPVDRAIIFSIWPIFEILAEI